MSRIQRWWAGYHAYLTHPRTPEWVTLAHAIAAIILVWSLVFLIQYFYHVTRPPIVCEPVNAFGDVLYSYETDGRHQFNCQYLAE